MKKKTFFRLIASIMLCQFAGIIGSVFTMPAIGGWYSTIQKPFFTPPNWVFAPVWTTLFLLMGISLFLVWEKGLVEKKSQVAVGVFGFQLVLNVLWSVLFFGLQNPFLAFIEIVFLWLSILATIILFYRISKKAGILLIPYLLWVCLATFLNYSVWILNL